MIYPADTHWWIRVGRFLNLLDPDANMLSPTLVQTWVATGQAAWVAFDDAWTHHADASATVMSIGWAVAAHTTHQLNKLNRAKARALEAPDEPADH